jgi:short-subunit dehydrogenase
VAEPEFLQRYGPWAVIAGGSEGVGEAFAHRLAERGLNLLLVARKPKPLEAVSAAVRGRHGVEVRTLPLDLTAADAPDRIEAALAGGEVGMLVYNAGADDRVAAFLDRPPEAAERLIALNVLTPTRLVRRLAPAMTARGRGGIVLLSSFASCVGTPGNLVYAATKAYSNVFAEGLWYELGQKGVHVLGLIIGITQTPAMERMGLSFEGIKVPADPYDIADEALANLDKGPTLHGGGTEDDAMRLRALPRAQAVLSIAQFSHAVVTNEASEGGAGDLVESDS